MRPRIRRELNSEAPPAAGRDSFIPEIREETDPEGSSASEPGKMRIRTEFPIFLGFLAALENSREESGPFPAGLSQEFPGMWS